MPTATTTSPNSPKAAKPAAKSRAQTASASRTALAQSTQAKATQGEGRAHALDPPDRVGRYADARPRRARPSTCSATTPSAPC